MNEDEIMEEVVEESLEAPDIQRPAFDSEFFNYIRYVNELKNVPRHVKETLWTLAEEVGFAYYTKEDVNMILSHIEITFNYILCSLPAWKTSWRTLQNLEQAKIMLINLVSRGRGGAERRTQQTQISVRQQEVSLAKSLERPQSGLLARFSRLFGRG